jgi:hypothetical protein
MNHSLRTPLSRARGLGSAKHGVGHFIQQRATAIFLAVLLPWFALSILLGTDGSYDSVMGWMKHPVNAAGLCHWGCCAHCIFARQHGHPRYLSSHRDPFGRQSIRWSLSP